MKVQVVAFASAAEMLGTGPLEVEIAAGSTVHGLLETLTRLHPDLGKLRDRLAVAVDGELVATTRELADGSEIALLPPVSGG